MKIPINKDPEKIKENFFKGFTMKQTISFILALGSAIGIIAFCSFYGNLPISVASYIAMPVLFVICACGFMERDKQSLVEMIKSTVRIIFSNPAFYQTDMDDQIIPENEKQQKKKKAGKKSRTKAKEGEA